MTELLAPAGDLERLKIALLYGADAVYIGGSLYSLRANATNFSLEEIEEGVKFAHKLNKKVYVTVNIVLHNKELKNLVKYLKQLDKIGVDAIIVSDLSIIEEAKKNTNLEIHLSTQASTLNTESALLYKNLGVKRIVLAREMTYEEIKEIRKNVDIDIECFIHGAMCASYSGRCVLSNFLTNRDANRGGCAQICRWDFKLLNQDKNIIQGEKDFTFCSKDLSMIEHIKEMIDLGIKSFKIEGRMRSVYYIATVVKCYRKAIDNYYKGIYDVKEYKKILDRVANRDSSVQFFDGNSDYNCNYYNGRVEISNQDFLGMVLDYKDGIATIEQRNYFKKGDKVIFFGPKLDEVEYTINDIYKDGELIDIVRHPKEIVTIKLPFKVSVNDMMKIKID